MTTRLGSGLSTPLVALESMHNARVAQQELQFQQAKAAVAVQEMQLQQAKLIQQQEIQIQQAKIAQQQRELQMTVAQQQREIQVKIAQSQQQQQQQELQIKAAHAQRQQHELQLKIQQELHAKAVAAHELQVKVAPTRSIGTNAPTAGVVLSGVLTGVAPSLSPPVPTDAHPSPPMGGLPQLSPNALSPTRIHGQYAIKKNVATTSACGRRSLVERPETVYVTSCCFLSLGYAPWNCTDWDLRRTVSRASSWSEAHDSHGEKVPTL